VAAPARGEGGDPVKTLIINSYAGSLVLGALAAKAEIIGSYEDSGFGLPIQQANFPHLNFIANIKDWPAQDLSETIVLAHPPCSAFSVQNTSRATKGVSSDAFSCTVKVLDYAMRNKAIAIAIESVMGALPGAWEVHQRFADHNGYHLYRITKNSLLFGCPQWRERFWAVFVRKGAGGTVTSPGTMAWLLAPDIQTLESAGVRVLNQTGMTPSVFDRELTRIQRRLRGQPDYQDRKTKKWRRDTRYRPIKLTPKQLRQIFVDPPVFNGPRPLALDDRLQQLVFPRRDVGKVGRDYVSKFSSSQVAFLNPQGYAPVLLGSSWWYLDGKNLSLPAYNRIMGFPTDYVFPAKFDDTRSLMYLSKGVCPPVATWIWRNIAAHVGGRPFDGNISIRVLAQPDRVTGFRLGRKFDPAHHDDVWTWVRPEDRFNEEMED
jgi:site-specific DNA-cytosine methylase